MRIRNAFVTSRSNEGVFLLPEPIFQRIDAKTRFFRKILLKIPQKLVTTIFISYTIENRNAPLGVGVAARSIIRRKNVLRRKISG